MKSYNYIVVIIYKLFFFYFILLQAFAQENDGDIQSPPQNIVPEISEDEIKDVLGGSICRCTGYAGILRAVQSAVAKMGGGHPSSTD